ncbi:hypothetical protein [Nakamurella endophytica]|uniref:hypothetical protein n=1 Tax=Nakamurella endophytica TaxID=1748367 RepID=UPI001668292E|nr:hypothetical protein [Nakamurella endophytica]
MSDACTGVTVNPSGRAESRIASRTTAARVAPHTASLRASWVRAAYTNGLVACSTSTTSSPLASSTEWSISEVKHMGSP